MIYVLTQSYFLWLAVKNMVSPHKSILLFDEENVNSIKNIDPSAFLIVDSDFNYSEYIAIFDEIECHQCLVIVSSDAIKCMYKLIPHHYEIDVTSSLVCIQETINCFLMREGAKIKNRKLLTRRESNILLRSLCYISVKKISHELNIPKKTVYMHRMNACRKLGLRKVYEFNGCKNHGL
ncbi:LuxR C-terminal-related transcriptional regulator [Enterobacter roggenkampii]